MTTTATYKTRKKIGYKAKKQISNVIVYIILGVLSVIWLFPILWIVLQSFDNRGFAFVSYMVPKNWSFQNYVNLFTDTSTSLRFPKWFGNTVILAVVNCFLSTFITLSVSYAFSRLRFKGRTTIMKTLMIIGMFPGFLSMIAVYNILKLIGLHQSLFSLMIIYAAGAAMGYFISKGFFDTIPRDLEEAARIDGASNAKIFVSIILPLSKPIIIYTALMAFLAPWGDYMMVNYLLGRNLDKVNVAAGLYNLLTQDNINKYFTTFAAGAVLSAILPTALFIWLQKYYIEGITGGSVK